MAITLVSHALGTTGPNSAVTSGMTTSGSNLLIAAVGNYSGGTNPTVTDSSRTGVI
jgi:hypothetical protein